jgi:hypothetical protein
MPRKAASRSPLRIWLARRRNTPNSSRSVTGRVSRLPRQLVAPVKASYRESTDAQDLVAVAGAPSSCWTPRRGAISAGLRHFRLLRHRACV